MNKKKLLVLAMTLSMVAILAIGGTLAYFTDTAEKTNTFTVGNVDIELTEPNWDATGSEEAKDAYPGEALAKDPTVKNIGANPCFVRISVTGLKQFGEKGDITYETANVTGALGENWVLHSDGYFYYTKPLSANEETTKLFEQIRMPLGLTGGEEADDIVVTAEAVQAQGAAPSWTNEVNGQKPVMQMGATEIAAWFNTVNSANADTNN